MRKRGIERKKIEGGKERKKHRGREREEEIKREGGEKSGE